MSRRRAVGIISVALAFVFVVLAAIQPGPPPSEDEGVISVVGDVEGVSDEDVDETVDEEADETNATVTDVSDGDTFSVRFDTGEEARVRMLGVDTPETVDPRKPVQCFGKEASTFTKTLLAHARVRLEADPMADERDKYGRLLRNVLTADGTDLNAHLVREGYAHAYLSFPLDPVRKKQLKDLETEAKAAKRGLWGDLCNL